MIYVVEDDKSIRELVAYALGSAGYETESFTSSGEFFAALDAGRARRVLLDIMLPGEDGLASQKMLQAQHPLPGRHITMEKNLSLPGKWRGWSAQ